MARPGTPAGPRDGARRRGSRPLEQAAWGAATIALIAVATVRSAGWLFVLCVLTAVLTTSLALTGGRSMRSILVAGTMPFIAAIRALPWLAGGVARLRGTGAGTGLRVVATATVSVALLAAFGGLLASADLYFSEAIERIVPDLSAGEVFRWIFLAGATVLTAGGAAFLAAGPPRLSGLDRTEGRKVRRWEWAVPLGLLTLLFGFFVAVQAVVLLGEQRLAGEYADAARSGFFQLGVVTALTLLVLAGAARWAPREQPADRLLLRVVLGSLTVLTLVIAVTALHRMNLYTAEYGLTRLRLLVFCCEIWIMLVLVLVLLAGVRIRAPWLPRVAIAAGVLALLGLAVANPDGLIAERNIAQAAEREIDLIYLEDLSPDAVPAVLRLPPAQRDCVLGAMTTGLGYPDTDWRSWNLGRERGRRLIDEHLTGPAMICRS